MPQDRIQQPTHSQQTRCKTFSNYAHGSDPNRVWNTTERKYALEALLKGVFQKEATEQPRHLNRNKSREIHYNSLKHFLLRGFSKHLPWFRCSGKGEHLNLATRQNPAVNPLTANVLQDFLQLRPFRSLAGLECRGMQMCPGGVSGRGIHQTRSRTAHASEPEQNSKNSPQLIEKLSIARVKQASLLVQMQWKRGASEPCIKAESGSQSTHNKRVARFSATAPVVQIPTGFGTPQNANTPMGHF